MSVIGIGKCTEFNQKGTLKSLSQEDTDVDFMEEAKIFVAHCYGLRGQFIKESAKPPQLRSLPPTDPDLEFNIKRAQYQTMMWHSCVNGHPPNKVPCEFGWERGHRNKDTSTSYVTYRTWSDTSSSIKKHSMQLFNIVTTTTEYHRGGGGGDTT